MAGSRTTEHRRRISATRVALALAFIEMGNELIVTYSANAWDLDDLREDLRLYWPRFVRVVRQ